MCVRDRLKELGIELPSGVRAMGSYVPVVITGNLCFTAGQTPRVNGKMKYAGKMGAGATLEEGYQAARLCAINCLSIIDQAVGIERVARIVKVTGFVNAAPDFTEPTQVINGASDLLMEVFGEQGRHARSAVGVQSLPSNAIAEVEMVVMLKDDGEAVAD